VRTRVSRFAISIVLLLWAVPLAAQSVSLTILHTNDTHGHLRPFSYPNVVPPGSELEGLKVRTDIGGIARRATLVNRIRQQMKARGTAIWVVDVGDFSDGTPFSTEYHGEADLAAMNAVGYDFGTLGNHEFNNSLAQLKKLVGLAKYPLLCANATVTATNEPFLPPSRIEKVGAVRIALFGLLTREAGTYPAAKEGLTVADEIETARRVVPALRKQADIVILLSHAGDGVDQRLAAAVPGIDVIVGGHSHTRLPLGEFVWRSEDLKADDVNGTVIVQAYQWGGDLGRLDLLFAKDATGAWHVARYRAQLLPVTPDIPADPAVGAVVQQFWGPIESRFGEVIGTADGDFSSRGDDQAPYNLVADAVRETFGTDIEFENQGGVRAPLVNGKITRDDLVNVDPFNNTVMTFSITGKDLLRILRASTPAVSGVRYRLERGELKDVTVNGQPVDENRTYTGATNSYFAQSAMKGMEVKDTGMARLDVLVNYIRKKGTIKPAYDGRRVIVR
jgi:5'-nucleotidase/UDP-sugar diphosphatase